MKIVIAPDSFKGSLTAAEAAQAIERGIRNAFPEADTVLVPMADGGEGSLEPIVRSAGGTFVTHTVRDPFGSPVDAAYGLLADGTTAVVEMARASGLLLVPAPLRNPGLTSTYGTGELIRHALDKGCRRFIVALGGSATNDGGAGMLEALGMAFYDASGCVIHPSGGNLEQIARIDDAAFDPRIAESDFLLACDVNNPLIGVHGATAVYAPQKGAAPSNIEHLERNMRHWADLVESKTNLRLHDYPGAGAAGGLAGAFLAFFPSRLRPGIEVVIDAAGLRRHLSGADLAITGEGSLDAQTASGKAPLGVAREAQSLGIPVIALAGAVRPDLRALYEGGINCAFSIVNTPMTLDEAITRAAELLEHAAEQAVRAFGAGR
ncbi:glycerate kinase [Paenibacillus xanthanilyticus]|uniref:Glycerate kinase n=1 Tax=Paenibacillus xanthanilyticus TaxID=1783531 RepID=A0ABV8K2H0_9BACL